MIRKSLIVNGLTFARVPLIGAWFVLAILQENIVATYGRSLYALVIGLFCGRWTLMALGEVDRGLMVG